MKGELGKAFEDCLGLLKQGYQIGDCILKYPWLQDEIEPLLETALLVSSAPRVTPDEEFRRESKARLVSRIRQEAAEADMNRSREAAPSSGWLGLLAGGAAALPLSRRRLAAPAMSGLLLAMATLLIVYSIFTLGPAAPDLGSKCTLSVLSGQIEVMPPGTASWQPAGDGMTLDAGVRVKTGDDSRAVLTFFEGSTIELEPGTDIEVESVVGGDGESPQIVMKQWLGRTWNRVVKKIDPGSRYEIQTPSACALVRGTLFEVDVDEDGFTTVRTFDGLVSVIAEEEEVHVPAGHQVNVESGQPPADFSDIPAADNELIVNVTMPAVASVIDPDWASTGHLPSGVAFNQIPGSTSALAADGTQSITVRQPVAGTYRLIFRGTSQGTADVQIRGVSSGAAAFQVDETYEVNADSDTLVRMRLMFEDGRLVGAELADAEPLSGRAAENLVVTPMVESSSTPVGSSSGSDQPGGPQGSEGGQPGVTVPPGTGDQQPGSTTTPSTTAEPGATVQPGSGTTPAGGGSGDVPDIGGPTEPKPTGTYSNEKYVLAVVTVGAGKVTEPGMGVFTYEKGTVVTLVATSNDGWEFYGWTGNVTDPSSRITTIVMDQPQTVTASFILTR